jgi:hypothetical protein
VEALRRKGDELGIREMKNEGDADQHGEKQIIADKLSSPKNPR